MKTFALFKIDPWIRKPQCSCGKDAVFQKIDRAKLGTRHYCTYVCEGCR